MAQHRPTGSETTPPHAPRSSRFGSEPPSVEDDGDVWRYAILELHARNDDDEDSNPDFRINPDLDADACRITPNMMRIHYLVGVRHFAFRENRPVTV